MHTHFIVLLILEFTAFFANASMFRRLRGRGTVAERRTSNHQAQLPNIGTHNMPPNSGLASSRPEAVENLADFKLPMPTPQPATFDGAYCRGAGCQYRVTPPPLTMAPPMTPPPLPLGGNLLSGTEFCRGLGCITGMGMPGDPALQTFSLNCVHLFQDLGGGLEGYDVDRKVAQVHASFTNVCKKRVGILEQPACPTYADTVLAAISPKVDQTTVGGAVEVCRDLYWFIDGFKHAEIALKLVAAALPKGKSLLAADLNRFGSGGVGPSSPRGLKWREFAWIHHMKQSPPLVPQQLANDGSIAGALLQLDTNSLEPKPLLDGEDSPENTPHGLPKYTQNPPCDIKGKHVVPQKGTKYQIAPGSPDGAVPPVEVAGALFDYCSNQFSEIMMGFSQTAAETVEMTRSWCAWQSSISSWTGKTEEYGHPDWSYQTCYGAKMLVAFALRDQLDDPKTGLSAQQVCKKIFLSIGTVHKTEEVVRKAWETALRGPPTPGVPAADDAEMQRLLQEAQRYANEIFRKLRGQKQAYERMNNVKMDASAFEASNVQVASPPPAPDLPDSDDIDPTALLALSVKRVRQQKRVGFILQDSLKSWGRGA